MTANARLKDIPQLARDGSNIQAFAEAVREVLQTFRGYRGDKLDKALTLREATQKGVLLSDGSFAGSSARTIEVKRPDDTTTSWSASADGANRLRFTTLAGSLMMAGKWKLQPKVTLAGGDRYGRTVTITVSELFD